MTGNTYEFYELVTLQNQKYNPLKNEEKLKCIELEHISKENGNIIGWIDSNSQKSIKTMFYKNNVLYGKLRPYLRKYYKANFDGVCSTEIWVFEANEKIVTNDYLYYLVQTNKFNRFANVSAGTKMPRADWDFVKRCVFKIPDIEEQDRIVKILSASSRAINMNENLLEKTKELRKYQEIEIINIFASDLKITRKKLFNILTSYNEKNKNSNYELASIGKYGMKLRSDIYYKDLASDYSKNKVLKPNCLAFGMGSTQIDYGINLTLDNYSISGAYKTYSIKGINSYYLNMWMQVFNKKYSIRYMIEGARRGKSIDMNGLMDEEVSYPSIDLQEKIVKYFIELDKEILLIEKKVEQLKKQKKGLMQLLLTGLIRVNVDEQ